MNAIPQLLGIKYPKTSWQAVKIDQSVDLNQRGKQWERSKKAAI